MTEVSAVDFYFKHRNRIEQWAALRIAARGELHAALLQAAHSAATDGKVRVELSRTESSPTYVQLPLVPEPDFEVYVEWSWVEKYLLKPGHWRCWATLQVVLPPDPPPGLWQAVGDAVPEDLRRELGLTRAGQNRWPWWGPIVPEDDHLDPATYRQHCHDLAVRARQELTRPIADAIEAWRKGSD